MGGREFEYKCSNKGSGCGSVGRVVLPTPEIHGSNPVIVKIIYNQLYLKGENKEKRGRDRPN